jgi:hypothetical protein
MQSKRKNATRHANLARNIKILEWNFSMFVRIEKRRGSGPAREALICLQFRGLLKEPVKGVTAVAGTIFPEDEVSLPADATDPFRIDHL